MILQLSAGQGPAECELAVGKLYERLHEEYDDLQIICSLVGKKKGGFCSIRFETAYDLRFLEGSVLWVCKSPYRPQHKRKNWYVDISVLHELPDNAPDSGVRFETFRCGGKGGQKVNKTETGVRAIHLATGLAVVSTEARSQYLNRQIALNRLCDILAQQRQENNDRRETLARIEHLRLQRGNPIRIYEELDFILRIIN